MLVSTPAVNPDCASPALVSVLLLVMNCRNDPCPESRVLTMVSKLNPKSMPVTLLEPGETLVMDCGVLVPVMSAANVVLPLPASIFVGSSPPTRFVSAVPTAPVRPLVRKVCTPMSVEVAPGREEVTLESTTRTV